MICNYGEHGEKFYVVIKGTVGVKVPTDVKTSCKNYYEIMRYIIKQGESIIKYKDNHSWVVKKFIDVFGITKLIKCDSLDNLLQILQNYKEEKEEK